MDSLRAGIHTPSVSVGSRHSFTPLSIPGTPLSEYEFAGRSIDVLNETYILVTGGLGYIGSHTTLELLKAGHNVIVIDNLSNSHHTALDRIRLLVNEHCAGLDKKTAPILEFHHIDYQNSADLRLVLDRYTLPRSPSGSDHYIARTSKISGVVHFAAYKAVAESIHLPLSYYSNNVAGIISFLETLQEYGIKTLVFSSSATIYGEINEQESTGIAEEFCVHAAETYQKDNEIMRMQQGCRGIANPYGRTKWMCEAILWDLCVSDPEWRVAALRYFNPVGCDPSGLLGEDPLGIPNNLMPVVCKVLRGDIPALNVFGSDYDTPDGTGVRDFIHVSDLAKGHLAAIQAAGDDKLLNPFRSFNLGSGKGHSVLELVATMKEVSGKDIPMQFTVRRPGDVAISVAKPSRAERELLWKTERDLKDCCRDTWNFLLKHPYGYRNTGLDGI